MRKFICSMSYELSADTSDDARKLLRAELCGRRWKDRVDEKLLPRNSLWIQRTAAEDETTHQLHDACTRDLVNAAAAVRATGLPIKVTRAWIHVSGGGTFGLAKGELLSPAADPG